MKTVQQFLVVFWRERERTPWSQPVDEAGIKIQEEERNLSVSWEANIRARGKRVISKQQEGAFFYILWPARWAHPPRGTQIPGWKPHPKPTLTNPHPKSPKQRTISHPLNGPKAAASHQAVAVGYFHRKTKGKGKLIEEERRKKNLYVTESKSTRSTR